VAEPLKNLFGPDVVALVGDMVASTYPRFDKAAFLSLALDGYEALELTPRARHISAALAQTLPQDREKAVGILTNSLGAEIEKAELTGMASFAYMPIVYFIADEGLDCYEASMRAQYEVTKRFTAEFSIRAFIERYPVETMARLRVWADDSNVHVRRLVSEGTRPRLPWAARLRGFQEDPAPVIELLELLKDDPEEYVRRSVANNLNDISKDHPDLAVQVAARWWRDASHDRKRLVRHGLRTLIKAGHLGALDVLGYGPDSPVAVRVVTCTPDGLKIGEKVKIEAVIENPSGEEAGALVDLRVHFVKANGSTSPKVFKGSELTLEPGGEGIVRKTISLAQHSTRKHYPGTHRVEVVVNGVAHPGPTFTLSAE
jgi:3-methyladenine DNA glycosylase AlkC